MLGQRRDTSGYEGGPKSTHLDPDRVALRGLASRVKRAMGIEPTRATLPSLGNKRFGAAAVAKCDQRVNFRGMWGHVGLRGDTRCANFRAQAFLSKVHGRVTSRPLFSLAGCARSIHPNASTDQD